MKRREFIKAGLGAAALAATSSRTMAQASPTALAADMAANGSESLGAVPPNKLAPRRCELFDFDWRFHPMPEATQFQHAVAIDHWHWKMGAEHDAAEMTRAHIDTNRGGWQAADTKKAQMNQVGYAWFRATLPPLHHPRREISFTHVDDNGEVYLNGKLLRRHQGWESPFTVRLDSAWRHDGPNVLTVRVHNANGPGGVYGPVVLGAVPSEAKYLSPDLDVSSWRKVQLPHDYIVEGRYNKNADTGHGSLPTFPAWYHKTFTLPASDQGKSVWLYFEGAFRDAEIYMNGKRVGYHTGGYTSFHVDITKEAHYGAEKNVLAVRVDPADFEGWWYEGGGIYRHVWLNVADTLHVAPWGVYAFADVKGVKTSHPSAAITIETTVANLGHGDENCEVTSHVLDPAGHVVGHAQSRLTVPSNLAKTTAAGKTSALHSDIDQPSGLHDGAKTTQHVALDSARLWSLEERHLYKVITEISRGGKAVDRHEQTFGIRTLRFDPNEGFFLNEKHVKLQGCCNHQDFAGVGTGVPDSIFYYRMKLLQEKTGCNAIRCSHNPMAPAMYDACDELGLLVMDENRHPGSSVAAKSWVGQPYQNTWHVENMVLRDRNHPSVIMWSMWNEEWAIQGNAYGKKMMAALMRAVHKHDATRPVTCAGNQGTGKVWLVGPGAVENLLGVNYNYGDYDWLHKKYPNKMIFGSETGSSEECRGVYHTNNVTDHLTSYMTPEGNWQPLATRKFIAGGFCWTGFDYRGETSPFGWPEINSNYGMLDMCGFPKDYSFYYKSWWDEAKPLVHIFPHWNWPGKEGHNIPVWCFSNCDRVELFLNGRSLGSKNMPKYLHLQWDHVKYEPGTLIARAYKGRRLVASDIIHTTGAPAALKLSPYRTHLLADGQDTTPIGVTVVDAHGRPVPTADNMVHFAVRGAGVNAGVGNGDPSCHEPNQANYRSAFKGLCMVLVRADQRGGAVHVTARGRGLRSATARLMVRQRG